MIRAENFNETYYARRNAPNFNQFKNRYHFIDEHGRQYMIASENKQVFQNTNVQFKPRNSSNIKKHYKCVTNSYSHIKMYVKIYKNKMDWFNWKDMNKPITLMKKDDKSITYTVILKSTDKPEEKAATGIIYVKGIDINVLLCNEMLNK